MNYLKSHLAFVAIIVLTIIVLAFSALILVYSMTSHKTGTKMNDKPKSVVTKKDVPTNEVPDKFPKDIPVEADAKITQNYNATSVDGTFQATRVFETKKTLDANFKIYQDYLKNNNWKIESTVNQPEYKMLYASSGASTIQIAMNDNKVAKVTTIDISYADKSATKPAAKTAAPTPAATPAANTAPKATK